MFGGGIPISRIELDGHLSSPEGEGSGGFIGASLEICGADCSLDFSDGIKIVDPSPGDSFNDAIDNGLVGAVEGVIETGEQVSVCVHAGAEALVGHEDRRGGGATMSRMCAPRPAMSRRTRLAPRRRRMTLTG
ncbi:hypothetical protein [Kribbella sp. NPDC023855]|uniref:hypothetical protein n=1 Tax=Kribbella sp. NPDC023855 TaxID=3154698 RepID=UPI0034095641